jgi:hypothetical protein
MPKNSQRKIVYLASLMGVLTLTSALLLALAPPPLKSDGNYENLWAADASGGDATNDLAQTIFATRVEAKPGAWKYIYIHDSAGQPWQNAGVGDHFLVASGFGRPDGQIVMTQRWNNQNPAAASQGVSKIDPACISICVAGDFNSKKPTGAQVRRLTELVSALQTQLGIGGDCVYLLPDAAGAAGIGKDFPVSDVRQEILP